MLLYQLINLNEEKKVTLEQVVKKLQESHLPTVARVSGLHYNHVWRIKSGKDKNPQTKTVVAISDALKEIESGNTRSK